MTRLDRRDVIRATAAGVGTTLLCGAGSLPAGATSNQELPSYADWIPAGDAVVNDEGNISFVHYDIVETMEVFALEDDDEDDDEDDEDEETETMLGPLVYALFSAAFKWWELEQAGLDQAILGQSGSNASEDPQTEDVPASEYLGIGDVELFLGSFDAAEIESVYQERGFVESDRPGIYVDESAEKAVAWSEDYFVFARSVDQVASVLDAREGTAERRYEANPEFGRLLMETGTGESTFLAYGIDQPLEISAEDDELDLGFEVFDGTQGFAQTASFFDDLEAATARTAVAYPSLGDVDTATLEESLGTDAAERSIDQDGRFVVVDATFADGEDDESDSETPTATPDDTETATPADSGTATPADPGTATDAEGGTETGTRSDPGDPGGDGDEGAPGMGIVSALASLGGVGYLLARRLGRDAE